MSVTVNQRNRAVSLKSIEAITSARAFSYKKLFALPGGLNVVDGSGSPFGEDTDAGWWGSALSDSDGVLAEPAVLTYTGRLSAYVFKLVGINGNYPVDFTISIYKNSVLLDTQSIVGNSQESLEVTLDKAYDIDTYVLTVTKISVANDVLKIATASFNSSLSSFMKEPSRRIHGMVEVLYNNSIRDNTVTGNEGAHGSSVYSITDGTQAYSDKYFKLHDNNLTGEYKVIGEVSEVGWWPKTMPDSSGVYAVPQTLSLQFSQRNLFGLSIHCGPYGDLYDYPVDFTITAYTTTGTEVVEVTGNASPIYTTNQLFRNVSRLDITISKTSNPGRPCVIMYIPMESIMMYYDKDLIDINLLEELSFEDSLESLGGISANELTVRFNNEDNSFYFNNAQSPIAGYIKKNRRIRAWLGVEPFGNGEVLWSPLGTFWTYSWDVPVGSLVAKTVALDIIGLLNTVTYYDHGVYRDITLYEAIEIVLTSAKRKFDFLEWEIDPALDEISIGTIWFEYDTYAAALNKIASCDFIDIYSDRDGRIVAKYKPEQAATQDDVWSNSTNVIHTTYPTLYTAPANDIKVHITNVKLAQEILLDTTVGETVHAGDVRVFKFNKIAHDASPSVDATAKHTEEWYSWGLIVTFTSDGVFNSVYVQGETLSVDNSSFVERVNSEAILENGTVECEVLSDFIQDAGHATRILKRMYDRSEVSVYDAKVTYRGDIQLTLTNNIYLADGIAPSNLYSIKRHQLNWNGALSGTAELSTYAYVPEAPAVDQIRFTIMQNDGGEVTDRGTFMANSGTTWAEWIGSGYTFDDGLRLIVSGGQIMHDEGVYQLQYINDGDPVTSVNGRAVSSSDEIIAGTTYKLQNLYL